MEPVHFFNFLKISRRANADFFYLVQMFKIKKKMFPSLHPTTKLNRCPSQSVDLHTVLPYIYSTMQRHYLSMNLRN